MTLLTVSGVVTAAETKARRRFKRAQLGRSVWIWRLVVVLVVAATADRPAYGCRCGHTFLAKSFDAAQWVVLATVTEVDIGMGGRAQLAIAEPFKGPKNSELTLERYLSSCSHGLEKGETWVFFLGAAREASSGAEAAWPTICGSSARLQPEAGYDPQRASALAAALRTKAADPSATPDLPWMAYRSQSASCTLEKPMLGPGGVGTLRFRDSPGDFRLDVTFQADRKPSESDRSFTEFTLEISGVPHAVESTTIGTGTPFSFSASSSASAYILESLLGGARGRVIAGLDDDLRTPVSMTHFAQAARDFADCRERRPSPGTGWLIIDKETLYSTEPVLRALPAKLWWRLVATDGRDRPAVESHEDGVWNQVETGSYHLTGYCNEKETTQSLVIADGETARLVLHCF